MCADFGGNSCSMMEASQLLHESLKVLNEAGGAASAYRAALTGVDRLWHLTSGGCSDPELPWRAG